MIGDQSVRVEQRDADPVDRLVRSLSKNRRPDDLHRLLVAVETHPQIGFPVERPDPGLFVPRRPGVFSDRLDDLQRGRRSLLGEQAFDLGPAVGPVGGARLLGAGGEGAKGGEGDGESGVCDG